MPTLLKVTPPQLDVVWGRVLPTLVEVCERHPDQYTPDSLRARFETGDYQLWLITEDSDLLALFVTQIYVSDAGVLIATIRICAAVNDTPAAEWIGLLSEVEDWAKAQGCVRLWMEARRGWLRSLRPAGYTAGHVVLDKDLTV